MSIELISSKSGWQQLLIVPLWGMQIHNPCIFKEIHPRWHALKKQQCVPIHTFSYISFTTSFVYSLWPYVMCIINIELSPCRSVWGVGWGWGVDTLWMQLSNWLTVKLRAKTKESVTLSERYIGDVRCFRPLRISVRTSIFIGWWKVKSVEEGCNLKKKKDCTSVI